MADKPLRFETAAVRIQAERGPHREHSVPIFATSSFVFDDAEQGRALFQGEIDGHIYSRYANPNNDEFVEKLCAMEGLEAGVSTASGMAAMFISIAAFLRQGDHVVASRSLFGSTFQILTQLLPRWGITTTMVDLTAPQEAWAGAVQPTTKMIFVETPSNPGLELADLAWLGGLAKERGLILNVDNCFATPYLQTPAAFGAHLVTHSATKLIDGQGRVLGGAVLGSKDLIDEVQFLLRHTGPAMSPFHGWILSKSLETLAVRVDRHCAQALALAEYLQEQPGVNRVRYPFLPSHPQYELAQKQMRQGGSIVTFEVAGGYDGAVAFLDALQTISRSANLGDTRSIATHPASTTHSKLTDEERAAVAITPGLVRLSVGLEHLDDLKEDLDRGLATARTV